MPKGGRDTRVMMAKRNRARIGSKIGLMPTLFLIVAVLYLARDILIPLTVAILLAFLLTPAATWLERRLLGRVLSIVVVVCTALAVLVTITWVLEQQFVEVGAKLPDYRQNIQDKVRRLRGLSNGSIGKAAQGVETTLKSMASTNPSIPASAPIAVAPTRIATEREEKPPAQISRDPDTVQNYSEPWSWPKMLGQYSSAFFSPLATMGMILVFVIFLLGNRGDLRDRILRLVGDARLHVTTQALDEAATRITHYLLMQSAINLAYGICVGIGLWIIGMTSAEGRFPNVMLWALLAMLLRFLPYLGPWIAAFLPVVLSLAVFSNGGVFFATVGLYVGLEITTANVIEPWLYGASTGMSALAILVSAVFWTWLWGPVGLLLATPMTVCLVVLGKYVPQLQFLAVLLGDEQALEPSVRMYQRLLSLDQEEAGALAHKYREEHGLERVFDEVIIPALVMAARDRYFGKLDPDREAFFRQAMRNLVEELGEAQKKQSGWTGGMKSGATVLCLPAHDEPDEIVGLMIVQLLELIGQPAIAVSQVSLAGEMLNLIEAQASPVVCISALPPAALAHARYLCKRIGNRFAALPAVVGLWTSKTDPKTCLERLSGGDGHVRVVTTLAGALGEMREMVQTLILHE